MQIVFLGHAGFMVKTKHALVIMDAWLSLDGAFDAGWFQLPQNHFMAATVQEAVTNSNVPVYIYISHEHKDHFDTKFLQTLKGDIHFVIPKFRRTLLQEHLEAITQYPITVLNDEEVFKFTDGSITIYTDDSEMDRDSAVLLQADGYNFLNLNDCKIFDRLPYLKNKVGTLHAFAAQFSGATWHPTCYNYDSNQYAAISRKKNIIKFNTVVQAIKVLQPQYYIPSAGPACFLDPKTIHLNFEAVNIFPRVPQFLKYLYGRNVIAAENALELMPGESLDITNSSYIKNSGIDYESDFEHYIKNYAAQYEGFFTARNKTFNNLYLGKLLNNLKISLENKLAGFNSHKLIDRKLYISITELANTFLAIDFVTKKVETVSSIEAEHYYALVADALAFDRVLEGLQTWEDFSLTFRMRLNRAPDAYQNLIHGFLILEASDMEFLCERFRAFEQNEERINITVNHTQYTIKRYCPHQGADLKFATIEEDRYVVCPRHGWYFDMENGGLSENELCSLNAQCYEPE
jgi:UDP-MurNAc hydroxylase